MPKSNYVKTYTNLKTGKIGKSLKGKDTTDPAEWDKRAKSSLKDGDKITYQIGYTKTGKAKVTQVTVDYSDGMRSVTRFGARLSKKHGAKSAEKKKK